MQRKRIGAKRHVGLLFELFWDLDTHPQFGYVQRAGFGKFLLPGTVLPRKLDQFRGGFSVIAANATLFFH